MAQLINIKLLKAVEIIKDKDELFDAFHNWANNTSPKFKAETAFNHPDIFEEDILAFLEELKYEWNGKQWDYLSTYTLPETIKKAGL